jgi:diguanylate cyclase (GGDEF)-like protein
MRNYLRAPRVEQGTFIVDRKGTILGFDHAMETLTGWSAIEVVGRDKSACGSLATDRGEEAPLCAGPLYEGQIPVTGRCQSMTLQINCRDRRWLEAEAIAERLDGPGDRARVTVLRVLTRSAEDEGRTGIERHDPLTLLPNAEAFRLALESDFSAAFKTARPLALILADVDHLRQANDRWGHKAGNEILQKLAGILRVTVEDESRIFRMGDDDFAILMPDSGRGEARQQAAALRSTVERYRFFQRREHGPREPKITLSLGAASFPADAERATDLVDRAAEALEEARSMGRNRVWCYLRRPRVPLHVPVFFDGSESLLVGYTRDLSPSGIFVQTSAPIDIGMRCAFSFPLPGHDGRVHVIGRVVRTIPPEVSVEVHESRVPGMGVEFELFGGSTDRRAIEAYLHRNEATTLRPEVGPLSTNI